jgi:hypothetical protein
MAWNFTLPEHCKIVSGTNAGPVTTNGVVTLDSISMKNAIKVWIVAQLIHTAGAAEVITPMVGATVATAVTAITFTTPWWLNAATATTDTLVRQADAVTCAFTVAVTGQLMVIEIDPADALAQNITFDCLGGSISTSATAANFVSVNYFIQERYSQSTPPAAITD